MRDDSTSRRRLSASTGLTESGSSACWPKTRGGLVARQDRLVRGAVRQPDAALEAVAKRADGFQHHRLGEMAWQVDAAADWNLSIGHIEASQA